MKMGVDADYIYGYMAKKGDVEWDIDYLKNKFDLAANLDGFLKEYTYADLIQWLEDDEIDDWEDVKSYLGLLIEYPYDEEYLYFTHFDLFEKFPSRRICEIDELVKEYARLSGVKNYEVFKWKEFGFFS
jgi:hypothetical protein